MKVYFHKFWDGLFDGTNPVNVHFFLELFTKVFDEVCVVGTIDDSDILCDTVYHGSALEYKAWNKTVLFSGESERGIDKSRYDLVLCCERTHDNIVNCPLFVPYLWCKGVDFQSKAPIVQVPPQEVVAIISNANGHVRNSLLESMEQAGIPIVYAGTYKNNTGFTIPGVYGNDEFIDFVSQFKFVISMENSRDDTYITEKICTGFLANNIPIYWGSTRVTDYFNPDRFINMNDNPDAITQIKEMTSKKWLEMVNQPIFTGGSLWRTVDDIVRDCKVVLNPCPAFPLVKQIYFLCHKTYEAEKYKMLTSMIQRLGIPPYMYTFLAPTWGTDLTVDTYSHHVRSTLHDMLPWWYGPETLKYGSLSLILNYRELFEDITKRYASSAMIITLESDIVPIYPALHRLPDFFSFCHANKSTWGSIHFGYGSKCRDDDNLPVAASADDFKLTRHLTTRCTDTMLWQGGCAEKILKYMKETEEYSEPIDHYLMRYFETRDPFCHVWSNHAFFKQTSTYSDYPPNTQLCQKHFADCNAPGEVPLRVGSA
jgi:hypothetical protein